MRIYHICHLPDPTNGIFYVLMTLPGEQRRLGNDVRVFNVVDGPACNETVSFGSVEGLKRLFIAERPDIVVFHGVFYKEIYPLSKALLKAGIPYLIELHGALSHQNMRKSRLKKLVARTLFLDNVVRKAAAIVYLNDNEVDNSAIRHLNNRDVVIPNGCYPFVPVEDDNRDCSKSGKTEILFLGRIDRSHKGLDVLADAIDILREKGMSEKIHFSFYGNGFEEDMQWMRSRIEGMGDIAGYYGPVYGEDKIKIFGRSDIFILTSRYEGFPMAILEALSAGLPCLVTPATNVADIIKENDCGWITALDAGQIARTVCEAVDDFSSRSDSMKDNAVRASREYNWESIARLSVDTYRDIADCFKKKFVAL